MKHSIVSFILLLVLVTSVTEESKSQSLEDKIGQMILVGFRGTDIDENHRIVSDIRDHNLGGVVLYSTDMQGDGDTRNVESPEQLSRLTESLQDYASTPLFVAVDQEGGRVNRLDQSYGFPTAHSHRRIGAENDEDYTRDQAETIAETLENVGVNINFAPVLDLYSNPANPIIGRLNRSFSSDPDEVANHASIFINTHRQNGVLNAAKHFPGYGSFADQNYRDIPDVTDTWEETELEPYQQLIAEDNLDIIMVSNVFNHQLDEEYPASLSSNIINDVLRQQLGFDGVILAESPQMQEITEHYGFEEGVRLQFKAGADMLQFANNLVYNENVVEEVIEIGVELVENGEIPESQIDASYNRIMNLKESL